MALLKKFDLSGKQLGEASIADELLDAVANSQMVKDYLVALRANARQWSANTKTRAEVCHSGQKPHPQKGTGRARQGYLGAPQYKGGGRVHSPRPKFDQHVKMNRQEKKAVVRSLFCEKIHEGHARILQFKALEEPKTSVVAQFLKQLSLTGKRVLFLVDGLYAGEQSPSEKHRNFIKSLNNIPKIQFSFLSNVSGYDLALHPEIVILDTAIDELMVALGGKTSA